MSSPSAGFRQTRSNSLAGAAGIVALLCASFVGFSYLPWPGAIASGWAVAALMFGGGAVVHRLAEGTLLPDSTRLRSIATFGAGALIVQAALHLVAWLGF